MPRKLITFKDRSINLRPAAGTVIVTLLLIGACSLFVMGTEIKITLANLKNDPVSFSELVHRGLSKYHYRYVEIEGFANYKNLLTSNTESNLVVEQFYALENASTGQIILVQTEHYPTTKPEYKTVRGIVRRFHPDYEDFLRDLVENDQTNGWEINPEFYINEGELPLSKNDRQTLLIRVYIGAGLFVLMLISFLIPGKSSY